jgi:hypothetical protein
MGKTISIRISAWDDKGNIHRVTVEVPSTFTMNQAKAAASEELGAIIVKVAFN